jgi:hypothetical protein
LYAFLISPMRTAHPTYLVLLDAITLTIFGKNSKLWCSNLKISITKQKWLLT